MKGHVKLVPDVWGYIRENKLAYPKGLYWEFKCDESPRHARSYSKGGQNTKEFTRMKDLSEWLIIMRLSCEAGRTLYVKYSTILYRGPVYVKYSTILYRGPVWPCMAPIRPL